MVPRDLRQISLIQRIRSAGTARGHLRPGIAQANRAVEHEPAGRGDAVKHQPVEKHRQVDEARLI